VRVVVCFFRIFLFYWLGEKGLLDSGGGGGLFLTFGFKYIFFRFWVLGSRGGCLWIFFKKMFWGKGVGVVVRLHNQISIIIFYS
jgi:hypothetical protein